MTLNAYFHRIGYDGPRDATLETLRALHALHPAAIPFEAVDALLDRPISLDPAAIAAKLIGAGRGGYCFEQNLLFKQVLAEMGFTVTGLLGRVLWMTDPTGPQNPRTHMALRVTLDGEDWLADVGFGSGFPTAPLKLSDPAPQQAGRDLFRLTPTGHGHLLEIQGEDGWIRAYEMSSEPHIDADYGPPNWYCATHPDSVFRKLFMIARVTSEARYSLLGNRLTVRKADGTMDRRTLTADELEDALRTDFLLPVQPDWRPVIERNVSGT